MQSHQLNSPYISYTNDRFLAPNSRNFNAPQSIRQQHAPPSNHRNKEYLFGSGNEYNLPSNQVSPQLRHAKNVNTELRYRSNVFPLE